MTVRERILVRGCTYENVLNLAQGYIEGIEHDIGGTREGEEELFAKMFDDAEGATCKAEHIKRRALPASLARCAMSIDVATTSRGGSDTTGIALGGLCHDGTAIALDDLSGKHKASVWADRAIKIYFEWRCDVIVVETNKGGDLVTEILRAVADKRELSVIVLGKTELTPQHVPGVIYIREVFARGEKADRAKPVGTAYEKGRIVHVEGKAFTEYEDLLTTWIPSPGQKSPDRLDAFVHLFIDLLGLKDDRPDAKKNFAGIGALAAAVQGTPAPSVTAAPVLAVPGNLATLLGIGGDGGDGRI